MRSPHGSARAGQAARDHPTTHARIKAAGGNQGSLRHWAPLWGQSKAGQGRAVGELDVAPLVGG